MKGKCWILLVLMLPSVLFSQTDSEKRIRIGEVQQNYELYFRGDATEETPDKALEQALSALMKEIDAFADTARDVWITPNSFTDKIGRVEMARGDRFRAFVFVKKEDVVTSLSAPPAVSEPAPTVVETPVSAPPAVSEPAPTEEEAPVSAPKKSVSVIEEIKRVQTLSELRPLLVQRKESGEVLDYNRYSVLSDAAMYYVVVFTREGDIVAVLSPGREERVNLKTGMDEKLSKYKGYGAIAVLLSKNH